MRVCSHVRSAAFGGTRTRGARVSKSTVSLLAADVHRPISPYLRLIRHFVLFLGAGQRIHTWERPPGSRADTAQTYFPASFVRAIRARRFDEDVEGVNVLDYFFNFSLLMLASISSFNDPLSSRHRVPNSCTYDLS